MIFTCDQDFLKFDNNLKISVKTDRPTESLLWVMKGQKFVLLFIIRILLY
jgi:hypothetical protein